MAKETIKTPIMEQYKELKEKHPEAVILFRIGDFYEAYDEDASKIGEILGVTVTRRLNSKEKGSDGHALKLAGFPHHALDTYLPKLIKAGERVAVCDHLDGTNNLSAKEYPSDEEEVGSNKEEHIWTQEEVKTLLAHHEQDTENMLNEYDKLKNELKEEKLRNLDIVLSIISESIKALKGEIPSTLAGYFYNSLGKLEVIKIKNNLNFRLTSDEINYLIGEASKSQNEQN